MHFALRCVLVDFRHQLIPTASAKLVKIGFCFRLLRLEHVQTVLPISRLLHLVLKHAFSTVSASTTEPPSGTKNVQMVQKVIYEL